ncbi:MAG: hypothetical protein HYR78_08350 [Nitrospirae bacterium]|nr:hypothetical protein [Nitrospirota bacterium]
MVRMLCASFFLAILLGAFSCRAEEISLVINNLKLKENNLQLDFILTNNTEKPIWFCKDIDDKSSIEYEVKITEKEVSFRFASVIVPKDVLLEEPIWAKYSKLEPGSKFRGSINVNVPLTESVPFKKKTTSDAFQVISFAETLKLEMGVYKADLEARKNECCRDDSNSQVSFVNCFWAEKNKEQIIRQQIENQNIPIIVR